jgi:hypothetical protein
MLRTPPGGQRYTAHTAPSGWWRFAVLVVAAELIAAVLGLSSLVLAGVALVAPGFALSGLLPGRVRELALSRACLSPVLGLAVTSVALTSVARLGLPLTEVSVRAVVALLVLSGLLVERAGARGAAGAGLLGPAAGARRRTVAEQRAERQRVLFGALIDGALLLAAVALAFVLSWRVIGELPVPGDDWAKYLLYADEIRRQGSLLLTNELWMGGRPFSEDPGMPSLEGAALLMTGEAAGALVRTILVLSLLQVVAVYGVARAWFGRAGAFAAAAALAVVPASQNILGWHGLANVGALAIVVLILAQLGAWLAGELDRRGEFGLAIALLGVAAAHRFTTLFVAGTLLVVLLAATVFGPRRALLTQAARTFVMAALLGIPLALDLRERSENAGGTLPYTSYLATKVDLDLALRDLSWPLVLIAALCVVGLVALRRLPRAAWPALALALVAVLLGFGWAFHLPLYYSRVTFFLPLPLALLVGAAIGTAATWITARSRARVAHGGVSATLGTGTPANAGGGRGAGAPAGASVGVPLRWIVVPAMLAALGGSVLGAVAARSWRQAEEVRQYYAFASPPALRALDGLAARLKPDEIVATDRCWSFLATWLLHTRTYPALEEQDIQPKAELLIARRAAAILHGTAEGRRLMRELPVRYAVLDPTCPVNGYRFFPPGEPLFAGARLAIVRLDPDRKNPPAPDRPRPKRPTR